MKPIRLEIDGLNSFETKQVLNFDELGNGVFGIFGKTGSGKSTILDAMTLALYGSTSRSKQNIDFINTKCKKAVVSLEFEIFVSGKNKIFLVTRTFTVRKNAVESSAVLIEKKRNSEDEVVAEGVGKVNEKIYHYVGLGAEEFSKCIALPQGEFSAFLKAGPAKRTEIMSNIFDLAKYGEKLAVSVKNKLNEYDKQVVALTASKELVSFATDEVLENAKNRFENFSGEYGEINRNLEVKSKEYADLSKAVEKKKKLDELLKKIEKLNLELPEIETLKTKTAKNQSANSVKNDYEKLKVTINDEKELASKISVLNEGRLKAKSELDEANIEWKDFQTEYTNKLFEYNSKLAKLGELDNLAEELENLQKEETHVNEKISEKKEELVSAEENLNYLQTNLVKIDDDIEKIDEFIEANKPDVDLTYALEQTKGIESEIVLIDDFYKQIEGLVDQTNVDLASVKEEYSSAIKQEREFASKREHIQNSIEVAFEDSDSTNFSKLRSCDKQLEGMTKVQAQIDAITSSIDKIHFDTEKRMAEVSVLCEQIENEQLSLSKQEAAIASKEKELAKARDTKDELVGNNVVTYLANHLQIGDYCPVCNERVMQRRYLDRFDIDSAESRIIQNNNELKSLRFERDKIFTNLVSLKSRYEYEKAQIEINKSELKSLSEGKAELYQKYVDRNDNSKENFEKLQNLLIRTSDSLEELIDLQSQIRDAEQRVIINKVQAGTKVTVYQNYLESLINVLYELQKKKAEREFAIYNLSEKYKNLQEYKRQIAEGKNIELLIDRKKEEKIKLREDKVRVSDEIASEQKHISETGTAIEVLSEKLSNILKQINSTKAKITISGVPEGASLESEKEEINKLIAKLKYDYSEKELKLVTVRENLSRTENEYNVKSSILVSKSSEISALEKNINDIMQEFGFKDKEELEDYFVSQSELKANQEKISSFENELKIAEIQRDEILRDLPENVDENYAKELKAEIDEYGLKVKELSENVGEARAEYERIKDAHSKNRSISEELEKQTHNLDLAKELASLLKGKALAEYVAEEYLSEITEGANVKLGLLLDGRYTLKFKDKEFVVEDNFSDGEERPANTLSGGETFLVSLSLALSISESISLLSERSMDFFFLDEGFGTLDKELVSTAMTALYKLESQNLRIGLISHITELSDQIKNKVIVTKGENGSKIRIEHSL